MLVRFLSFAASVLGSARHRAILVSCLAVVFAFSSVIGITLFHNGPSNNGASARGSNNASDNETPLWLNGQQVEDKDKVQTSHQSESKEKATAERAAPPDEAAPENTTPAPTPELSLSAETVTLIDKAGQVTARHTGVSAALTWAATLNDTPTDELKLTAEKTDSSTILHINASDTALAGTYTVKLHAEIIGSDGQVTKVTKTVNVIVPASAQ